MAKTASPIQEVNGKREWTQREGDSYLVTGVDLRGRRFRKSGSWQYVAAINVYRGNRWLVRDGRRYLIQTVWN